MRQDRAAMSDPAPRRKSFRILPLVVSAVTWLILLIGVLWAFGALWFDLPPVLMPRVVAGLFGAGVLLAAVVLRPRWRAKLGIAGAVMLTMIWWFTLKPRQNRDWKPEVERTASAEIAGELVTIHNVRNFDYRTVTDFTPRWETRQVDLRKLEGMDIFITYWGSPYMAHPIVSFDFGADGHLCFSIETRPEKGEGYSAVKGLYRQFELIYVVADERDVIRVRSNYRKGEDVYLYRLQAPRAKEAFLEYVRTINELHASPRWYNAVTNNCTTAIRHQRAADERKPFDWRMLVNGYGDQMLYENGTIDRSLPFAELKQRSLINPRARAANADPEFSTRIRHGLPGLSQ
jgi:hypothetical protein